MREELGRALETRGFVVDKVACYRTRAVTLTSDETATLASADVVFIGAPSTWSVAGAHVATTATVVVPGETTAQVVRRTHPHVLVGWNAAALANLA
jgi:uroporphyrinogen-III synthase